MIDNGRKRIIPNEVLLPEVARLISEGHTVTLTVRGNSMNPFLVDRRDRIVLGPFTDNDLQLNTVVLARDTNGRIVFHRITRRNGKELTLQGDGNIRITEQTNVDDVMGIMIAAIRKEKRISVQWPYLAALFFLVAETNPCKAMVTGDIQKNQKSNNPISTNYENQGRIYFTSDW